MILVFGRSGQVATELQRLAEVTALGRAEADLMSPGAAAEAIRARAPAIVINAAAWTAVDQAEEMEAAALQLNAAAPGEMARTCADLGIPFLHVSTDYVFDGSGTRPWREDDPARPQNAYGRTKLAGETAVEAAGGNAAILRTSWVFSAHGSNFVKTMLRLSETRDRLSIVDDQVGGPTPAADIAATLLHMGRAMDGGQAGGLYHYSGTPAVSWAAFAREIFARAGRSVAISEIPTREFPTPARRPLNSRMDCSRLHADFGCAAPDWKAGLDQVLETLGARG